MSEEIKKLPPRKIRIAQNRKLKKIQLFDQLIWSVNFLKTMTYLYLILWVMQQFRGPVEANQFSKYISNWYQSLANLFYLSDKPSLKNYRAFTADDLAQIVLWITGVIAFLEVLSNLIEIMKPQTKPKASDHFIIRWGLQLLALLTFLLILYSSGFIGR